MCVVWDVAGSTELFTPETLLERLALTEYVVPPAADLARQAREFEQSEYELATTHISLSLLLASLCPDAALPLGAAGARVFSMWRD